MAVHFVCSLLYLLFVVAIYRQTCIVAPEEVVNGLSNCITGGFFVAPVIDSQLLLFERLQ